jgi:hypothetical protein
VISLARLSILRRAPLATLAGVAAASAAIRFVVALQVRTPLYYPDEYLYAAISRSIAHGTFGRVRGVRVPLSTTVSYVAPLLTSPVWLIQDVAIAYRLSQALASIAFASSAFAAYALARRVGINSSGACVVGVLALLIPAGAFTATLLSEPYAYPFFLVAVLVAVEAIATPTLLRFFATGAFAVGLCAVGGFQFLVFPAAFFAAYVVCSSGLRSAICRAATISAAGAIGIVALVAAGGGAYSTFITKVQQFGYPIGGLASWFAVNLFVFAVASGWVIVPGAVLGARGMVVSGQARARAFVALSGLLLCGFLFAAAIYGSNRLGLYERFTFYASPLVAIAFVWSIRIKSHSRIVYASVAYAGAAAAILLPQTSRLFISDDHSPTLLGLSYGLIVHLSSPPIVWAPLLALLAVMTGLFGTQRRYEVAFAAAAVCIVTSAAASRALVDLDEHAVPRLHTPTPTAFVTYRSGDPYYLMKSLFWNPQIRRVVVVGGHPSPDSFASIPAYPGPTGLLTAPSGRPIVGPFAIGPDTIVGNPRILPDSGDSGTFTKAPTLMVFGWYRNLGMLAPFGRIFASADRVGYRVILRLRSFRGSEALGLKCGAHPQRIIKFGPSGTEFTIRVPKGTHRDCRFGLAQGTVTDVASNSVIARASLTIAP